MSTDIHSNQPINQPPGAAGKFVHQATDAAKEIGGTATAAAKHVIDEVEAMKPDYLAIGIELNVLLSNDRKKWDQVKALYRDTHDAVKARHPQHP